MSKKLRIAFSLLSLLAAVFVIWTGLRLPPPVWILECGPAGGCEPTGRTWRVGGLEFVEIGPGFFLMGSDLQADANDLVGRVCRPMGLAWGRAVMLSNEMPVHWVRLRHSFAIATREITNRQYAEFAAGHAAAPYPDPSARRRPHNWAIVPADDEDPVRGLQWSEAAGYCAWLAKETGLPIRLPTEAEWEAAARAGTRSEYCFGDDERELGEYAWFRADSGQRARAVGTKRPNSWGLYDFHGNVWEWCQDIWHPSYVDAPADGRAWEQPELEPRWLNRRVCRGGGWLSSAEECRSASRKQGPVFAFGQSEGTVGVRPAFTPAD